MRSTSLSSTRPRTALALLATAGLLLGLLQAAHPQRADALGTSPLVDAPASYDAQTTCTTKPRPGTAALASYLLRTYPVTSSMGMMRACGTGGRSEHKDGRAFDWGADVARASTKKAAYAFINAALATDSAGNAHALARRMGIMYFIYNDTIWSSYADFAPRRYLNQACKSLSSCSRTLRHKNHVHISLGFAGAAAQTSWYRARGVRSEPVLFPGTRDLDPENTAVTGLVVRTDGTPTGSPFRLRAGLTYRIVATGTVRFGPDTVADANCVRTPAGYVPTDRGELLGLPEPFDPLDPLDPLDPVDTVDSPYALPLPTTHGLVFRGALRWEGGCTGNHTYEAWYTPATTQQLILRYVDDTPADNTGTFNVYVARGDIVLASLRR